MPLVLPRGKPLRLCDERRTSVAFLGTAGVEGMDQKSLENRVRRHAQRCGYRMLKSRRYSPPDLYDQYMLVDPSTGAPLVGYRYDASLKEVERWLTEDE
jgi:hypothetical protein